MSGQWGAVARVGWTAPAWDALSPGHRCHARSVCSMHTLQVDWGRHWLCLMIHTESQLSTELGLGGLQGGPAISPVWRSLSLKPHIQPLLVPKRHASSRPFQDLPGAPASSGPGMYSFLILENIILTLWPGSPAKSTPPSRLDWGCGAVGAVLPTRGE